MRLHEGAWCAGLFSATTPSGRVEGFFLILSTHSPPPPRCVGFRKITCDVQQIAGNMTRIEYDRQMDEEISTEELQIQDGIGFRSENNGLELQTWPKIIGISQIISGFITAILGILEVFVFPLIVDPARGDALHLGKDNCYGAGLWAGILMIITGSAATRASRTKRTSSVYLFFHLTLLTIVVYAGLSVLLIVGYSISWTTQDVYQNTEREIIHLLVTLSTELGLLFAVTAFIKYYSVVLFGEFGLISRWIACFIDCCVPICIVNELNMNGPPDRSLLEDSIVI